MKLVTLFLMLLTTDSNYIVKQFPMIMFPEFTCDDLLKKKVTMDHLPIGVRYFGKSKKGKQVLAYYCKNTLTGKFIQ